MNDGILFRGTTTYHGVEPSNDQNTKRYLVGFQYIKSDSDQIEFSSLCDKLRGTCLYTIILTFLPYGIYYNMFRYLNRISIFQFIPFELQFFFSLYFIYIGWKYSTRVSIGNKIPNTLHSICLFYLFVCIMTFDFMLALNITSYIITSETFLPIC